MEVKDDGKGLDPATIGSKAIEKGILTAEQLAKMPDQAILQLIFTAGFSTASNVSSLSGRGVGMDVVKTNTERIGGVVGLSSTPGNGTTVKLCIPLTLAIVPALLVRTRGHCYAIPQAKLLELIAVDADSKLGQIEELQGQRIYRLRGKIIPVISLAEILGYTALESPPSVTQGREPLDSNFKKSFESSTSLNLVILKFDQQVFALAVEEIEDSTDIVVKPLSSFLKELAMFSGATILGNGAVALTIDVNGLARAAMIKPLTAGEESATGLSAASSLSEALQNAAEYLLVDVGRTGLYAIPLNGVDRLEESRMDACGEIPVVQYRDQLLKIVSAESILNGSSQPSFKVGANLEPEGLAIVVLRTAGAHAGIQVRQILDIVTIQGSVRTLIRKQPGILGTLIHEGKVITILDVASVAILKACANLDRSKYQGSSITSFHQWRYQWRYQWRFRQKKIRARELQQRIGALSILLSTLANAGTESMSRGFKKSCAP
ncbi:MAG: chemotaxis protein CheW [Proteobacteria bacterium]|nr:chemotaxis protein CheW [Pseudomonadota bacterium]